MKVIEGKKLRVGDLVKYRSYKNQFGQDGKVIIHMVKGTPKDWYCIRNHVDIDQEIVHFKHIKKLVQKREKVLKFWVWV